MTIKTGLTSFVLAAALTLAPAPVQAAYNPGTFGIPVGVPNVTQYPALPIVTVEMFETPGTVVPGVTDEKPYIQAAATFLSNSGLTGRGGIIQFQNRDYLIHTGPVLLYNSIKVQGTCAYQGIWPQGGGATTANKCTGILNDTDNDSFAGNNINESFDGFDFKGPVPVFACNINSSGNITGFGIDYPGFGIPDGDYAVTIGLGYNGIGSGGVATIHAFGGIMTGGTVTSAGTGYYSAAAGGSLSPPSCTVSAATLGVHNGGSHIHLLTGVSSISITDSSFYSKTRGVDISTNGGASVFFNNITIQGNNFQGQSADAIRGGNGQFLTIRDNIIQYSGANGINIPWRTQNPVIDNNHFVGFYKAGAIGLNAGGIDANSGVGGILGGGSVTNNTCENITGPNGNEPCFYLSSGWATSSARSNGVFIAGNTSNGPVPVGMDLERMQHSQIGPNAYGSTTGATSIIVGADVLNNLFVGTLTSLANSNSAVVSDARNTFISSDPPTSWTPGLTDGTHHSTNSAAAGWYWVNGPLVTVQFSFTTSSLGSLSGPVFIDNLPFSVANVPATLNSVGSCSQMAGITFSAGYTFLGLDARPNTSQINLLKDGSGSAAVALQASELAAASSLLCQITYRMF